MAVSNNKRGSPARTLLVVAVVLGIALRLWAANTEDHQSPDTFQYVRQTAALLSGGIGALRGEAARFLAEPAMAAVPSVSRTLWLATLAGWSRLTNTTGVTSVVSFACFADILALGVLALLASEVLGVGAAATATLLYAVSPAALAISRHGWGDSFTSLLGLLTLLFAARALARAGSRWPLYALGVVGGLTFAIKESAFLQSAVVVLLTASLLGMRRQPRPAIVLASTFVAATLGTLAWNAYALGGMSTALHLVGIGRDVHGLVTYATVYQSGSPMEWADALFRVDPVVTTLGLAGVLVALKAFRRMLAECPVVLLCSALCVVLIVLPVLGKNLYNVRWIAPAYGPACVLAAFFLRTLWRRFAGRDGSAAHRWLPLAVCGLAVCGGIGVWRYMSLVALPDLQDLSLKMVLEGHN